MSMLLVNSYKFAQAVAPEAWSTVHDGAYNGGTNNYSNYTVRTYISRAMLPADATKMRITFGASSTVGMNIGKAYVGKSRGHHFDEAPSQIFFGGNAGHLIASANDTILSDEVDIDFDGTTDICISFYIPPGSNPNDRMGTLNGLGSLTGSVDIVGDSANTIGGTINLNTGTIRGIRKIEIYSGGTWNNVFQSMNQWAINWNNYTIRSKIDPGNIVLTRDIVRIGVFCQMTNLFIGNSAEGATPFDFLSTPHRLTFGGNNNTPSLDFRVMMTDEFDMTVLDLTKPILFSYHSATTRISQRTIPPSWQSSRYKAGNSADALTWQSGSSGWNTFLGPGLIDEKY